MGNLVVADDKDRQHRTKAGKPSKQWDYSKQAIVDFFDKINRVDPFTFPIDFEKFTFNAFAAFLKTFTKKISQRNTCDGDETVIVTATEVTIRLGAGSFSNACSAISHLFTECGIDKGTTTTSKHLWKKNALYLKGA